MWHFNEHFACTDGTSSSSAQLPMHGHWLQPQPQAAPEATYGHEQQLALPPPPLLLPSGPCCCAVGATLSMQRPTTTSRRRVLAGIGASRPRLPRRQMEGWVLAVSRGAGSQRLPCREIEGRLLAEFRSAGGQRLPRQEMERRVLAGSRGAGSYLAWRGNGSSDPAAPGPTGRAEVRGQGR